ncbi:L-threonylcarbamoyladenylate synthase [Pseudorhizobium tarimense]|uniref:Threonylcarbamoyl-AMP synthase n=1 Tax=Pseudorhizobium tarimense TaxID=1079109 RepID=A0ABV2H144_9HYPH|nr:L-threonylcarbamoyladenylate synthase [Pseudorhizobium tarimense]MCJ8517574.1 L-threonylcarbamoyladenylate synthase [Pseudorhizobium tarimense]
MTAKIIHISDGAETAIEAAKAALSKSLPVAIPTETVYGLAADATDPVAITRIYETKGRPRFNPLICHMADLAMAERYAIFDPVSRRLAEHFWPGPLTLVLPLREGGGIHPLATAGLDTVGIRVPKGLASALIHSFGRPLAAPSANTSGMVSPTSALHVTEDLGEKLGLIIDGDASPVGVESTIVRVEKDCIRLLRPGGVSAEALAAATALPILRPQSPSPTIEAPGMLASHYAPTAPVRLNARDVVPGEAIICFGDTSTLDLGQAALVLNLSPNGDLREAAANLFDYLKKADAASVNGIAVTPIPHEGLGEAINDRLTRAAAPRT